MALKDFPILQARYDDLQKQVVGILAESQPLRDEIARLTAEIQPLEARVRELVAQIKKIERPRLPAAKREIAVLVRGAGGKALSEVTK